jgi:uncharacterized protein YndB with AHSA1/START domain
MRALCKPRLAGLPRRHRITGTSTAAVAETRKKESAMTELVAKAKMLIRRSATDAFEAFVRPELITKFWLKGTTGPLAKDAHVEWQFMVPGATERVHVTAFDAPHHLAFAWSDGGLDVDMRFDEAQEGSAVVSVEACGFESEGGLEQVVDATEGFSIVLCDLKVFLESGHSAGLVEDKAALIQSAHHA